MEVDFYRLRFPCRPAARTRIWMGAGAAKPIGWPGEDRCGILQLPRESPPEGGRC
jgi:hypothetical protein